MAAVRAEGDAINHVRVATQCQDLVTARGVPELDPPVLARRGQSPAVGAKGYTANPSPVPLQRVKDCAVAHFPEQHSATVGFRGRSQAAAVRAEGQRGNLGRMFSKREYFLPARRIPQSHSRVGTSRGESPTVGAEDDTIQAIRWFAQDPYLLSAADVPDDDPPVVADCGQLATVRAQAGAVPPLLRMAGQRADEFAGARRPQLDHPIDPCRCEEPAIAAEGQRADFLGVADEGLCEAAGFGLPDSDRPVFATRYQAAVRGKRDSLNAVVMSGK